MSAFACLVVPYFVAAAVERVEPALRERPLIVVTGTPPATRVVDVNAAARVLGVHAPMTEAEARARCPQLTSRTVTDGVQAAARHALLDAALAVSPRVEDAGLGVVHVDASGLERLFGDANAVGQRLLREARAVGFTASVGLAESRAAARVAARLGRAITVVGAGREREMLAGASIALLEPDARTAATFARWGVRTLGELAALPRDGLAARLGAPGLRLHDQALGLDREPFLAYTPPAFYQEAQGLDWEIETLDALATVLTPVLDRLCARLAAGHLATDVLDVDLRLVSGEHHHRRVALAYPLGDARAMLALLRLDLEAHPPAGPVTGVAVTAQPVRAIPGQHGLWQPPLPAIRELATVLARLAALVGPGAVGSPFLVDSHRPDAVALARFDPANPARVAVGDARVGTAVGPGVGGAASPRAGVAEGVTPPGPVGKRLRHFPTPADGGVTPPATPALGLAAPPTPGPTAVPIPASSAGHAREIRRLRPHQSIDVADGATSTNTTISEPTAALTREPAAVQVPASSRRHTLAMRRLRPPRPIDVECGDDASDSPAAPASVQWSGTRYRVVTCAGPWRLSGAWWDVDGWARDEWDVALDDGTLCRIALDLRAGGWFLDAVYD